MLSFLLALSDLEDHDKITHIYTTYQKELLKYARNILRDSNKTFDEEDAVQNMYVSLIKYIKCIKFWDDEKQLHAYLLKMTLHECRKLQGRLVYHEDLNEYENILVSDDDFLIRINEIEEYQKIVEQIARMDEKYSIPMHLYWVNEMDVKEIAERMELPVKTIYTRLNRGKIILLKALDMEGDYAAR